MSGDYNQNSENKPPLQEDIAILEFTAQIYPDNRRVKVSFLLSPFKSNPNASLTLTNQGGVQLAGVSIVNIFVPENEVTLHIPANENKTGTYSIEMTLFYLEEAALNGDGDQKISLRQIPIKTITTSLSLP